jgi:hypothetical protein
METAARFWKFVPFGGLREVAVVLDLGRGMRDKIVTVRAGASAHPSHSTYSRKSIRSLP